MHPWTFQRLAEERQHELVRGAARARASHEARRRGAAGSHANRRATRYFGELLIRTGWRLVGPEAPTSGARPRLTLPSSGAGLLDPC